MIIGETDIEKVAKENELMRKVAKEIETFGVTDRQRLFLINLLALQLEDIDSLQAITGLIKDLNDSSTTSIFIHNE